MMNILNIKELMNRGHYVISAFLFSMCMLWGCDEYKDDMEGSFPEIPVFETKIVVEDDENAYVDGYSIYVNHKKEQIKIEVSSNQDDWEYEILYFYPNDYNYGDWFTVTSTKNNGQGSVTINLTKNYFYDERHITLAIYSGKIVKRISIMQKSGYLTLDYPKILRSQSEIEAFCEEGYTEIHANLILGDASIYRGGSLKDGEVLKDINGTTYVFKPSDITDLSFLNEFRQYNAGLYIVNTKVNKMPTLPENYYVYELMVSNSELSTLLSAKPGEDMGYIEKLDVSCNKLTNLDGIEYYRNISGLDVSYNNLYDVSSLPACYYLRDLNLSGLPITQGQVRLLHSLFSSGCTILAEDLKESESPYPTIKTLDTTNPVGGIALLAAELTSLGSEESPIISCGFYIGRTNDLSVMTKFQAEASQIGKYQIEHPVQFYSTYYVIAYAENKYGMTIGECKTFNTYSWVY